MNSDRTPPATPAVPFFASKAPGRVVATPLQAPATKERTRKLTDAETPAPR